MKILIYGSGAVGLGLGSCLLKAGSDVTFLSRPDTAQALRTNGLTRTGIFGHFHAEPNELAVCTSISEINDRTFDFILLSTKSHDSTSAAQHLASHRNLFNTHTKIVICQNGWGCAELFLKYFEKETIYNARIITGFTRPKPNHVVVTVHADAVHIGSIFGFPQDAVNELAASLATGDLPCETTDKIEHDLWAKMLYNCALNPLGAILRVPYGKLGEHPATREIMNHIIREVFAVMTAAGYATHWPDPQHFTHLFYSKLLPDTALHKSSMLQDMQAKRKTEIDALTGAVLSLAKKHNIVTPHTQTIHNLTLYYQELPDDNI